MRRGDVRAAILVLLNEQARNGYQLMQEIEERSDGAWRPSPGSVYPALSQLEDEGLIATEPSGSGKEFALTPAGEQHVKDNAEKLGEPWADLDDGTSGGQGELKKQLRPLMGAVAQIFQSGTESDVKQAAEVLAETRKKLYAILAESGDDA